MPGTDNQTLTPTPAVSLLILAGGQGSRMGGVDKGLVEFQGKPLVQHLLERFACCSDDVLISCNRNLETYEDLAAAFGAQLISDAEKDFPGPLAGIQQGLHHALHPALVVLPCDTPLLPAALIAQLAVAFQRHPDQVSLVHDGQRLQPLHAIIPSNAASRLDAYLAAGQRAVMGWYEQLGIQPLDCSADSAAFANINRPHELEQLSQER